MHHHLEGGRGMIALHSLLLLEPTVMSNRRTLIKKEEEEVEGV